MSVCDLQGVNRKRKFVSCPSKYNDIYNIFVRVLARSVSLTAGAKSGANVHENETGGISIPKGEGVLPGYVI